MAFPIDNPRTLILRVNAAKLGCAICSAPPRKSIPAGEPFPSGPYQGRYWCLDCWTLYYNEHTEHLADADTKLYVEEESKKLRLDRLRNGAEMIYEAGENRVFLTDRGTVLFDIQSAVALQPMEFDPERFNAMVKALQAVKGKVPGYETVPV
jgi:hypothetical protein